MDSKGKILKIGKIINGMAIGWVFEGGPNVAMLDFSGDGMKFAGWSVPELEEILQRGEE